MTTPDDHWRPVRPLEVLPRPLGVFDAKVPGANRWATGGTLCQNRKHAVYLALRPHDEAVRVCRGNEGARTMFVCAVCSPPKET